MSLFDVFICNRVVWTLNSIPKKGFWSGFKLYYIETFSRHINKFPGLYNRSYSLLYRHDLLTRNIFRRFLLHISVRFEHLVSEEIDAFCLMPVYFLEISNQIYLLAQCTVLFFYFLCINSSILSALKCHCNSYQI